MAFDLKKRFPTSCRDFPEGSTEHKKRKRSVSMASMTSDAGGTEEKEVTCTICHRYNAMLFMNFVSDGELVIVEQPWLDVVATLPNALHRKVFGT